MRQPRCACHQRRADRYSCRPRARCGQPRGTSLPADASDGALKRERTCCEDARGGASRPVIPERVKATPASAGARGKRQWQAQAAEQEDAEVGTGDDEGLMGRQGGEGPGRMRPRLREQHRTRRRRQVSKVCPARALIARSGSDALPTPKGNFRLAGPAALSQAEGLKPMPAHHSHWPARAAKIEPRQRPTGEAAARQGLRGASRRLRGHGRG